MKFATQISPLLNLSSNQAPTTNLSNNDIYFDITGFMLHKSFLCAGGKRGEDTCKGDGGGPLLCRLPGVEEERYVQVNHSA